jgi:hypothetical protein
MRGGRNMVEGDTKAGRAVSGGMPAITPDTGTRACRIFGSPWDPQQGQMPLQVSGATGWECLRVDCCECTTVK